MTKCCLCIYSQSLSLQVDLGPYCLYQSESLLTLYLVFPQAVLPLLYTSVKTWMLGIKFMNKNSDSKLGCWAIQNQAAGLHENNNNLFHILQCCQTSILLDFNLWDDSRGTIIHINAFLAYHLVQELFFNKNHFLEFLSVGLHQLNIFAAYRSTNIIQTFHTCPWTTRQRKSPALRAILIAKLHQRNQPH